MNFKELLTEKYLLGDKIDDEFIEIYTDPDPSDIEAIQEDNERRKALHKDGVRLAADADDHLFAWSYVVFHREIAEYLESKHKVLSNGTSDPWIIHLEFGDRMIYISSVNWKWFAKEKDRAEKVFPTIIKQLIRAFPNIKSAIEEKMADLLTKIKEKNAGTEPPPPWSEKH